MPRKKIWSETTIPRYKMKIQRMLLGVAGDVDTAKEVVSAVLGRYARGYGDYKKLTDELREVFGQRIPRGQFGLYRSALFKMQKEAEKGMDVEAVIQYFARVHGLNEDLLREIALHFGLLEKSREKEAKAPT
jgi:hypothetical protein